MEKLTVACPYRASCPTAPAIYKAAPGEAVLHGRYNLRAQREICAALFPTSPAGLYHLERCAEHPDNLLPRSSSCQTSVQGDCCRVQSKNSCRAPAAPVSAYRK